MMLKFITEENGQGSLEYALIIAFLSILLIAALTYFSTSLINSYKASAGKLPK